LSRGLTQEHLCFGNKPFLVPESCQMKSGAPIRRNIWRMNRHFEHFYGLNLLGKDCGFGRSAVATRIGYHIDWLNSVLIPNYRKHRSARSVKVQFSAVRNDLKELDECESRYKMFHRSIDNESERIDHFFHTVYIGWRFRNETNWICTGTLVARNLVVISAYCQIMGNDPPTEVNIAEGNPNEAKSRPKAVKIAEVIVHPKFNPETLEHDIAVVRLERNIVPTAQKYPICLWKNETHTPFLLHRMVKTGLESAFVESYPKYNSDCKKYLDERRMRAPDSFAFCTDTNADYMSFSSGAPIVWYRSDKTDNTTTQYLVGLIKCELSDEGLGVNTRISSYVSWIKSLL
uniref:Uncharacterized protein n=1 Tax=Anopheles atroparvus TaxID=41427 RepID=A0A182IZW1_ANOAO